MDILTSFDVDKFETIVIAQGAEKTLFSLVAKKVITMEQALEECDLTEKEFLEKMKEYGIDK